MSKDNITMDAKAEGLDTTDPRRQRPIKIDWDGMTGRMYIDHEHWGAVEWSEKRQAWCIEDAEGRCLSHHSHVHGEDRNKAAAVAQAKAMIRDGRMPTPEDAKEARNERLKLDRERRAKHPSEIRRREARAERDRLRKASWDADWQRRKAEDDEPFYEVVLDTLDLTDPDLWKSNSFARLRDRIIVEVQAKIADLECRGFGKDDDRLLQRAREILKLLWS